MRKHRKPHGLSAQVSQAPNLHWKRRSGRLVIPLAAGTFREWFIPLPFGGILTVTWRPMRDPDTLAPRCHEEGCGVAGSHYHRDTPDGEEIVPVPSRPNPAIEESVGG